MPLSGHWLRTLRDYLRAPRVDEVELEDCLRRVRRTLPAPVFWLVGKAQSGKTSIVRAITGSTQAEIGDGFRPMTRHSRLYAFPDEEDCLVRFLDTRGLGDPGYDPGEDLGVLEEQAHCVIVVMKAMDHAQQCVIEPLRAIRRAHPDWPVIVAQTWLHEGYPWSEPRHVLPYPFDREPWPPAVPQELARSLAYQRQMLGRLAADVRFVPIDFTLPEDGFEPQHYGLDALWEAIESAIPWGLRNLLREHEELRRGLRDVYFRRAHPHIVSWALAAGLAGGIPVPMVDLPLFVAIQVKMFHGLAKIYGQPMQSQRLAEVLGTLGLGLSVRLGLRELLKVLPGWGSAVSAVFAAASTYALGCTLCAYFSHVRQGDLPDPAMLRHLYRQQFAEGRRRLKRCLAQMARQRDGRADGARPGDGWAERAGAKEDPAGDGQNEPRRSGDRGVEDDALPDQDVWRKSADLGPDAQEPPP